MGTVNIKLKRESGYKFIATNENGFSATLDGPASIGGTDQGLRPMEMVLMGLAGCSSFDLLSILQKQRQQVTDVVIDVEGVRGEEVPSVYRKIHLVFTITGKVQENKVEKALSLAVDKYCSVAAMLHSTAEISWEYKVVEG